MEIFIQKNELVSNDSEMSDWARNGKQISAADGGFSTLQ